MDRFQSIHSAELLCLDAMKWLSRAQVDAAEGRHAMVKSSVNQACMLLDDARRAALSDGQIVTLKAVVR